MRTTWTETGPSIRRQLLFWWILFVVVQSAERLFLLKEAVEAESPSPTTLVQTIFVGLRGDFIVATIALVLASFVGIVLTMLWKGASAARGKELPLHWAYPLGLRAGGVFLGLILFILLFVDMGYYGHHRQRLDFVFLEYVGDLFNQAQVAGQSPQQAAKQTDAELNDWSKWGTRIAQFLLLELLAIGAWWWAFTKGVVPSLARWRPASALRANVTLGLCLLAGGAGFHHQGPYGIRIADIGSTVYYTLAQNPVLFASEALRVSLVSRDGVTKSTEAHALQDDEALKSMQELIGPDSQFPDPRFPLVKTQAAAMGSVRLDRLANIVVILIEGLDRRFLGRTHEGIPGTPFLDRLREESLYFENFFSNGVQTSRGLFATFCSYYPRHGAAAMKTRYAHDYACLPSWLERHGYRTEFVIGQHRDLNRLQTFMARNGLQRLMSESDFPPGAERIGLGMSDGALFSLVRDRLKDLQTSPEPFMLGTLTLATHHPFRVPDDHPEVRRLLELPDRYVAALRYTDLELGRMFADLERQGLLRNTVVFILGDHGRHENVGSTELERQAGHFASPLLIWMDDSLRDQARFRPRTVSAIASQVDILPTVLALNGIAQRMAPSLGRDLTCLFVKDCLHDNFAFLTSMYDDAIGIATSQGVLLYSLRTERLTEADLTFHVRSDGIAPTEPAVARRFHDLMALYQTSNAVLDQNRIWSWKEFGH